MGRIKNFFSRIGNGIKSGATKVWNGVRNGIGYVGRIAKPLSSMALGAGSILGRIPGTVGLVGKALQGGGAVLKSLTDSLPNSSVKEKINNAIEKGLNYGNSAINKAQNYANTISNTGQNYLYAGANIANKVGDIATDFVNR